MTQQDTSLDLHAVAVIIPALNEAANLRELLPPLCAMGFGQVLVCDNGSTDATRSIVEQHGASWVFEPRRGYGAACFAGMEAFTPSIKIVVFLDADLSHDFEAITQLVAPIATDEADFVLAARTPAMRERGSTTWPQRFANQSFPTLMYWGWGYRYRDMGPFRAIRRSCLEAMEMRDRAFGWTIEMQIRAVELGLRIREIPIAHQKRRHGKSKISGTIRGVFLAAYWIIRTCGWLWLTKRRRTRKAPSSGYRSNQ